jgi:hypothetical protein
MIPDLDIAVRVGKRHRPQQDRVEHAERGRVDADAERQRQNGDPGLRATGEQAPNGQTQIVRQRLQRVSPGRVRERPCPAPAGQHRPAEKGQHLTSIPPPRGPRRRLGGPGRQLLGEIGIDVLAAVRRQRSAQQGPPDHGRPHRDDSCRPSNVFNGVLNMRSPSMRIE